MYRGDTKFPSRSQYSSPPITLFYSRRLELRVTSLRGPVTVVQDTAGGRKSGQDVESGENNRRGPDRLALSKHQIRYQVECRVPSWSCPVGGRLVEWVACPIPPHGRRMIKRSLHHIPHHPLRE